MKKARIVIEFDPIPERHTAGAPAWFEANRKPLSLYESGNGRGLWSGAFNSYQRSADCIIYIDGRAVDFGRIADLEILEDG